MTTTGYLAMHLLHSHLKDVYDLLTLCVRAYVCDVLTSACGVRTCVYGRAGVARGGAGAGGRGDAYVKT